MTKGGEYWFMGLASLCKGGCCKATGRLRKNWKLKIENWFFNLINNSDFFSFSIFIFYINFLWFMDCHDFYEVSQWRRGQGVVFTNSSLWELLATRGNLVMATATPNPHCHCEALKKPWQSRDGALWQLIKTCHCESLSHTLSLREPKVRGNPLIY